MFAPRGWLKRPIYKRIYQAIADSTLLDRKWYRDNNLSAVTRWQDPVWHYITKGWEEGLDPSESFNTSFYIASNRDVQAARINPLFHFLEYGQPERRAALPPGQTLLSTVNPESARLRMFAEQPPSSRVTLVIDDFTPDHPILGDQQTISTANTIARALASRLRVVMFRTKNSTFGRPASGVELLTIDKASDYGDVSCGPEELWISTSWSATHSLGAHAHLVKLLYLVLECEVCTSRPGIDRLRAEEVLLEHLPRLVLANAELREHFAEVHSIDVPRQRTLGESVSKDGETQERPHSNTKVLSFVAFPSRPETLFSRGVELLESALATDAQFGRDWEIRCFGSDLAPVNLLNSVLVVPRAVVSEQHYWKTLEETDILVSLGAPGVSAPVVRDALSRGVVTVSNQSIASPSTSASSLFSSRSSSRLDLLKALATAVEFHTASAARRKRPRGQRQVVIPPGLLRELGAVPGND
jgi:hypothetical protein